MSTTRIGAILLRQFYLVRSNAMRFISMFYWPILDIAVWGLLTIYLDRIGNTEFNFVGVIVGAALLWQFLLRTHMGMTMAFLEDVWSRNFTNLFGSPLTLWEYVAGIAAMGLITSIVTFVAIALMAGAFFSFNVLTLGFSLIPFLLGLFIFGMALGQFNTAIVLRYGPSAEFIAWSVPFGLLPFGGVYYPTDTLPVYLEFIAKLFPLSYIFDGMRKILLEHTLSPQLALIGVGIAFMYLFLTSILLIYIYRSVLRKGLLARFSSETG